MPPKRKLDSVSDSTEEVADAAKNPPRQYSTNKHTLKVRARMQKLEGNEKLLDNRKRSNQSQITYAYNKLRSQPGWEKLSSEEQKAKKDEARDNVIKKLKATGKHVDCLAEELGLSKIAGVFIENDDNDMAWEDINLIDEQPELFDHLAGEDDRENGEKIPNLSAGEIRTREEHQVVKMYSGHKSDIFYKWQAYWMTSSRTLEHKIRLLRDGWKIIIEETVHESLRKLASKHQMSVRQLLSLLKKKKLLEKIQAKRPLANNDQEWANALAKEILFNFQSPEKFFTSGELALWRNRIICSNRSWFNLPGPSNWWQCCDNKVLVKENQLFTKKCGSMKAYKEAWNMVWSKKMPDSFQHVFLENDELKMIETTQEAEYINQIMTLQPPKFK